MPSDNACPECLEQPREIADRVPFCCSRHSCGTCGRRGRGRVQDIAQVLSGSVSDQEIANCMTSIKVPSFPGATP